MVAWETVDVKIKENIFEFIKKTTQDLIDSSPESFISARDSENDFDETFDNCWEMYIQQQVLNILEENNIPTNDIDYGEGVRTYAGCGPIFDKCRKFFYAFIEEEVKKL